MGGRRAVSDPDPVARDYLVLALRLDQHSPGLVDSYIGPADLKAAVDIEQFRRPALLREDAAALRARVADEILEPDRRDWLDAQLVALETHAGVLAGDVLPYEEQVRRCFSWSPVRRDESHFDDAAAELERMLPGPEPLHERLEAWDDRFTIDPERLPPVVAWLTDRLRERAGALFGLPDGEALSVSFVRGQPWSAYNWYAGGLRSRIDVNLDLPVRAGDLVWTIAHETYTGHHLEHVWKETELVERQGRLEASVLLINTPECLIGEGLADLGIRLAAPPASRVDLLVELFERSGLDLAADGTAAREAAERQVAMIAARRRLSEARVNAALLRHADGRSRDEVHAYLVRYARYPSHVAEKRLEFIEHPLWRTYVFVYHEGEALLGRWLDAVPEADRPSRFRRLLREQLTPRAIAAELEAGRS
jgi:hypothetical protein